MGKSPSGTPSDCDLVERRMHQAAEMDIPIGGGQVGAMDGPADKRARNPVR